MRAMKRKLIYFCLALLLVSCAPATEREPNVLVIAVDTLRADRLGCYGYEKDISPNLDRFAKEGTIFLRNYSQAPWTMPSFASIMTSLYPRVHRSAIRKYEGDAWYVARDAAKAGGEAPDRADYFTVYREDVTTLAELLGEHNYRTQAAISVPSIIRVFGVFRQGFTNIKTFEDDTDHPHGWATADLVSDYAIDWLGKHRDETFFLLLHYFDPHGPYDPPEPYRSQFYKDSKVKTERISTLYDGEVAFADHEIGRVLNHLNTLGLAKDTIVVLVSDHGEEFGEHDEVGHGYSLYDEVLHVPLIVRYPRKLKPARYGNLSRNIDIVPTILALMGIDPPEGIQGVNLLPHVEDVTSSESYAFSEALSKGPELYSLRTEDETVIWNATVNEEVTSTGNEAMLKKINEIKSANSRLAKEAEQRTVKVDHEVKDALRALGYLD